MKSRFIPPSRLRMRCARRVVQAAILLSAAATAAGAEWNEIGSGLPRAVSIRGCAINAQLPLDVPPGDAVPLYLGLDPNSSVEQMVTIAIE
jgi:hypothetical protein